MVRYKTEPGEKEQKILAEISLNTPNNLKRRKVTSAVSAVLCVIYAAFAVWMFVRGFVDNGFLLLGFAVLFLLIILFYKKFQLSIMQKVMKKKNNAVLGGTLEYVIDDDGVAITSARAKTTGRLSTDGASRTDISISCVSTTMSCSWINPA